MQPGTDMNQVRQYLEKGMSVSEVSRVTGYVREHVMKVCRDIRREFRIKDSPMVTKYDVLIAAAIVAFGMLLPYLIG